MIALVDYRAGNLASVKKAVEHLGFACTVTNDPAVVSRADKIIVPGVGHFSATREFSTTGMTTALSEQVRIGKPVLGICLGMQWMFESSEEAPDLSGLAAFPGQCRHFPQNVKSPHVGWNQLEIVRASRLLRGLPPEIFVYFTHAYCAPIVKDTIASCCYGVPFSAAVERDNLFGVQFHPEKSAETGLAMLKNFCTC